MFNKLKKQCKTSKRLNKYRRTKSHKKYGGKRGPRRQTPTPTPPPPPTPTPTPPRAYSIFPVHNNKNDVKIGDRITEMNSSQNKVKYYKIVPDRNFGFPSLKAQN